MGRKKMIAAGILIAAIVTVSVLVIHIKNNKKTQPEFVLSYAENQTPNYPTTLGAEYFAQLVEEQTEGRIKIAVYSEAQLGSEKEVIKQMQFGGIDFARLSLSQLAEFEPELNVLQMPYLYNDSQHMWKVLESSIGDDFLDVISDCDLIGMSWYDAGARNFYSSVKPIEKLEDMSGLRIRVQESELMADMVKALGAQPFQIAYSDVYSAIERGIVDGAENNWPSYETMQHYMVAEYFTVDEHARVPEVQVCSAHTWSKLSESDREIIIQCARKSAVYERELWQKQEEESKNIALSHGVKVIELSKEEKQRFRQAVMSVYEKYCKDYMDVLNEIIQMGD